jgi:uncharacterized protein (TIGR00299 family) protein
MAVKRVLIIDGSSAGISGDMLVSSLIDLGAPEKDVLDAMKAAATVLRRSEAEISVEEVKRGGFRCKLLSAKYKEEKTHYQAEELLEQVKAAAESTLYTKKAKEYAYEAVKLLVDVEAHLHTTDPKDLHLHETGSVDTVIDAIGAAFALEHLNLFEAEIYATPVAVGGGLIRFSHGITPAPAPAALRILTLKKIPFHGGPVEGELTTPTGAALLAALDPKPMHFYPQIKPLKVGLGGGVKEIDGVPNILRLILGEDLFSDLGDVIVQLESNIDDASGEVISRASEVLLREGALDVAIIPAYAKKGRPTWIIQALCNPEDVAKLSSILMVEAGTLGVRYHTVPRYVARRRIETTTLRIDGVNYKVRVKISETPEGRLIRAKPEYADLKAISQATGLPVRRLQEMVEDERRSWIEKRP